MIDMPENVLIADSLILAQAAQGARLGSSDEIRPEPVCSIDSDRELREIVKKLYIRDNKTLRQVSEILAQKYGYRCS